MNAQVMQLEDAGERPADIIDHQLTRMQADAVLWSLRALRQAQFMQLDLDDAENSRLAHHQKRILRILSEYVRPLCKDTPPTSMEKMVEILPLAEARLSATELPLCASDLTINALSENVGLTALERNFLRLKAAWTMESLLRLVFATYFNEVSVRELLMVLAAVLGVSMQDVREALHPYNFLYRSRLLKLNSALDHRFHCSMEDRLVVRPGLLQLFETANGDFQRLIHSLALPVPKEGLNQQDFSHLEQGWSLASGYLHGSINGKHKGANILLYGIPGVGKTEFARALVRASGATGFEIKSACSEHKIFDPDDRRDHYFLAGELLSRSLGSVLIFDDADGSLGQKNQDRHEDIFSSKAAINNMLESNPVPTIWILNDTRNIDTAVLRRFDVSIEFKRPPASITLRQLKRRLEPAGVSPQWMQRVSRIDEVTPAVVSRLERVSGRLMDATNVEQILTDSLEMSGIHLPRDSVARFNRAFCNAEPGIETICGFLENSPSARILLNGPTGTGKTALAKHLAETVDLAPRLIRPSDLLGPYIGQTEHKIARLFVATDPAAELIILDEFESIAEDRRGALRSWEISKVAELLSRLDEYEGRVIACTNLPDNVDPSIRRRFHLKARMGALTGQQRLDIVRLFTSEMALDIDLDPNTCRQIEGLDELAFGHIGNAFETARYMADLNAHLLLTLLRAELEGTNGRQQRKIGFLG